VNGELQKVESGFQSVEGRLATIEAVDVATQGDIPDVSQFITSADIPDMSYDDSELRGKVDDIISNTDEVALNSLSEIAQKFGELDGDM